MALPQELVAVQEVQIQLFKALGRRTPRRVDRVVGAQVGKVGKEGQQLDK